jgi:hypothetical protein
MCAGARKHGEFWWIIVLWAQQFVTLRRRAVLYTIAVVLLILWALGLVSSYTMGGFVHVLLVVAVVLVLLRVISGRSPV